jgi:hypothetical protein
MQQKFIIIIIISGVRLSLLVLSQPQMIGDGDYGKICGMKIVWGNKSTRRNSAPVPLFIFFCAVIQSGCVTMESLTKETLTRTSPFSYYSYISLIYWKLITITQMRRTVGAYPEEAPCRSHLHILLGVQFNIILQSTRRYFLFDYLFCESIGTAATPGLLCQRRVIVKVIVEKEMECRLAGETEFPGEILPQRYFCPSQNPT